MVTKIIALSVNVSLLYSSHISTPCFQNFSISSINGSSKISISIPGWGVRWKKEKRQGALCKRGRSPFFFPSTEKGMGEETDWVAGRHGCSPAALATVTAGGWDKMKGATRLTYSATYLG
jgi:hypothetical protein